MTRLVALLCFYAEDPAWLHDTIVSLEQAGVDHVVAADGAYALYPDGQASSGDASHDAIHRAAKIAGIRLSLVVPATKWAGNEIEKRSFMFRLADEYAPDWYLVIDGDERVIRCPPDLKEQLAATDADYGDVMSLEHDATVMHASAEDAAWPQIHFSRHVKPRRCLIRAVPGLTCGPRHLDYMTPDGRNLWGDEMGSPLRLPRMMIDHRNRHRPAERGDRQRAYVAERQRLRAEPEGTVDQVRSYPKPTSPARLKASNRLLRTAIRNYNAR